MNKLPVARTENIVVQNYEKEILIYDLLTNKAYCLNETSAIAYQACDGKTSFDALKREYKFTDEVIFLALDELKKNNLIADNQPYISPFAGIDRRELIRKVGLASMVALPVISSLVAPTAVMAQSLGTCPAGNITTVDGTTQRGRGGTCQCSNNPGNADSCNTTQGGQNGANVCRSGCVCSINQPPNCFGNVCLGTCG